MANWPIDVYIRGIIVAGLLLFFILAWSRGRESTRRSRRLSLGASLRVYRWSSISDYVELANAAAKAHALPVHAFLDGPFRRFLEICSDPEVPSRARARAMEFGRGVIAGYGEQQAEMDPAALHDRARALAAAWFGRPEVPNGDYMLEVFDGISNHNWRGKRQA